MTVKAVYASKTIAIYITENHVDDLLRGNIVLGPMIAAGETLAPEGIDIRLTVPGIQALRILQNVEENHQAFYRTETYEELVKRIAKEMFP